MLNSQSQPSISLPTQFDHVQRGALLVGGVGLLLCAVGAFFNTAQFFRSYLVAYLFWLGIGLGGVAWLMVFQLTGGRWGEAIRHLLVSSVMLTWLMVVLFVPLLFGLATLYPWVNPELVAQDPLLQHKQPYLNVPFFLLRALAYFVIWSAIVLLVWRWAVQPPSPGTTAEQVAAAEQRRRWSGVALAVYGLTITFAAIDWLMSLEPQWFSSIFGVLVAAGQVLTALAFAIIVLVGLLGQPAWAAVAPPGRINDLGNLLLAAVLFWAYLAFAQYLIIWSGNIPEEATWYLHRLRGGWRWVALFVLLLHFAVPFAVLLSSRVKRQGRLLAGVAATLLVADLVHLFWLVAPTFHADAFYLHWLDLITPLAIGGLWVAVFIWQLRRTLRLTGELPA